MGFGLPSSASAYDYEVPTGENTGAYIELGGSLFSPSKVSALFTDDNTSSRRFVDWDTEQGAGANIQVGWDFGRGRADLKLDVFYSGISSVDSQNATRDDFGFGVLTANGYWDIHNFKAAKYLVVTPYVGAGLGFMAGHMRATANERLTGLSRRDNATDVGGAARLMAGAQFQFHRHVALTFGYEFLAGDVGGKATPTLFTNQSIALGLRVTF